LGLYIENLTYSVNETEDYMKEQVEGYQVTGVGNVRIADDVLAVIASIATMEVDGVDSMAGNITKEIISKVSGKNLSKGVKVDVSGNEASVYLSINIKFGYSIPDISVKVQNKVKSAIENMTGIKVTNVHISYAGVAVEA